MLCIDSVMWQLLCGAVLCGDCAVWWLSDDDSEPILGEWLEGTLSPEEDTEPPPTSPVPPRLEVQGDSKRSRQPSTDEPPSLVPDKREPDGVSL